MPDKVVLLDATPPTKTWGRLAPPADGPRHIDQTVMYVVSAVTLTSTDKAAAPPLFQFGRFYCRFSKWQDA